MINKAYRAKGYQTSDSHNITELCSANIAPSQHRCMSRPIILSGTRGSRMNQKAMKYKEDAMENRADAHINAYDEFLPT